MLVTLLHLKNLSAIVIIGGVVIAFMCVAGCWIAGMGPLVVEGGCRQAVVGELGLFGKFNISHVILEGRPQMTCFRGPSQSTACTSPVFFYYLHTNTI